ncbi:MAG: carbon-nitrogen hydrolase family protein [Planctomycetaceae bacterium]
MRIAGVQMDIQLGDIAGNIERMAAHLRETTAAGARLTIFPECSATGYCFTTFEECRQFAQPVPGPVTDALQAACRAVDGYAVFGMIEADGERLFNVALLVGPDGIIDCYRKVHLPYLGLDMHTTPGDRPFAVCEVEGVRIGLNICYDSSFPEAARCLAILGADLIVLPTNWPPGAESLACTGIATRAMENAVYYAAINRVGTERGFSFIGRSSICAPDGTQLAFADGTTAQTLYAEIDVTQARRKRLVRVPGKHEIDRLADRRPEMYGPLSQPHHLPTPRTDHQAAGH